MRKNKLLKAIAIAAMAMCATFALAGCSSTSASNSASETPKVGHVSVTVVADEAATGNAKVTFAKVGEADKAAEPVEPTYDVVVNGEAVKAELAPGEWEVIATFGDLVKDAKIKVDSEKTTSVTFDFKNSDADKAPEVVEPEGENAAQGATGESAGSGGANVTPSPSPAPAPNPQPTHTHNWAWVANIVTVVDQDAWDEDVYRWARWCGVCNCEVSDSHTREMLAERGENHGTGNISVYDHTIHHDAVTHTEDHGRNQCTTCGAWQ